MECYFILNLTDALRYIMQLTLLCMYTTYWETNCVVVRFSPMYVGCQKYQVSFNCKKNSVNKHGIKMFIERLYLSNDPFLSNTTFDSEEILLTWQNRLWGVEFLVFLSRFEIFGLVFSFQIDKFLKNIKQRITK